jgi:hypothetical protein
LLISNGYFPGEYIHMPNGTLASVMDFYIDSRGSYSFLEEAEARDIVRKVIVRCNPNLSYTGEPPLVIAIYSGDVDFVDRLMRRGADPYMEYVAKKGVKMNAIKMLDGFLKSSSENEPSLERYRKVAEVMSGFGFSKDGR